MRFVFLFTITFSWVYRSDEVTGFERIKAWDELNGCNKEFLIVHYSAFVDFPLDFFLENNNNLYVFFL